MGKIRVLQLSDFHCGLNPKEKLKSILEQIKTEALKPDFIVLTGDFCNRGGDPYEKKPVLDNGLSILDRAQFFKNEVSTIVANWDPPIPNENILFCAGNHDFTRTVATNSHHILKSKPNDAQESFLSNSDAHLATFRLYHYLIKENNLASNGDFLDLMDCKLRTTSDNIEVQFIILNTSWLSNHVDALHTNGTEKCTNYEEFKAFQQENYDGLYTVESFEYNLEFIRKSEIAISRAMEEFLMVFGHSNWLDGLFEKIVNTEGYSIVLMHHPLDTIAFFEKVQVASIPGGTFYKLLSKLSSGPNTQKTPKGKTIILTGHEHPEIPEGLELSDMVSITSGALYELKDKKSIYTPFALYHSIDVDQNKLEYSRLDWKEGQINLSPLDTIRSIDLTTGISFTGVDKDVLNSNIPQLNKDISSRLNNISCLRQYYLLKQGIFSGIKSRWISMGGDVSVMVFQFGTIRKDIPLLKYDNVIYDFIFSEELEREKYIKKRIEQINEEFKRQFIDYKYCPIVIHILPYLIDSGKKVEENPQLRFYHEYLTQKIYVFDEISKALLLSPPEKFSNKINDFFANEFLKISLIDGYQLRMAYPKIDNDLIPNAL